MRASKAKKGCQGSLLRSAWPNTLELFRYPAETPTCANALLHYLCVDAWLRSSSWCMLGLICRSPSGIRRSVLFEKRPHSRRLAPSVGCEVIPSLWILENAGVLGTLTVSNVEDANRSAKSFAVDTPIWGAARNNAAEKCANTIVIRITVTNLWRPVACIFGRGEINTKRMAAITATRISNMNLRDKVFIPPEERKSIKGHHSL